MYINLNLLTSLVQEFFENHKLINTTTVLNALDFKAVPSTNYPIVNIEPVESNYADNLVSQGFLITIADIMNVKHIGEGNFRIMDHTQRVANDAILYLQNQLDFDASTNITVNVFEDDNSDRVAGVVFRINLIYFRDTNICVFDDILNITKDFIIKDNIVTFKNWIMHPFIDEYEVTFNGGDSWERMTKYSYEIEESEPNTIGQRLRLNPDLIIWNK